MAVQGWKGGLGHVSRCLVSERRVELTLYRPTLSAFSRFPRTPPTSRLLTLTATKLLPSRWGRDRTNLGAWVYLKVAPSEGYESAIDCSVEPPVCSIDLFIETSGKEISWCSWCIRTWGGDLDLGWGMPCCQQSLTFASVAWISTHVASGCLLQINHLGHTATRHWPFFQQPSQYSTMPPKSRSHPRAAAAKTTVVPAAYPGKKDGGMEEAQWNACRDILDNVYKAKEGR